MSACSIPDGADSTATFVTRFAPSPTGRLHLGHAFSALTAFEAARAAGGRCLLRIEDIDAVRCRPEFEDALHEDLAWLGLAWETPVRRQSEHLGAYREAVDGLAHRSLAYRCFRTRREVAVAAASAPHGPEAPFRGGPLAPADEVERLARGEPFAWRLSLVQAREALGADYDRLGYVEEGVELDHRSGVARPDAAGDVVLARRDVGVAYHLASVVDDARQGVTHVIRGEDLRDAVHVHRLLQALLGMPTPRYRHHRLLTAADGRRLSKRDGAPALAALRAQGVTAQEIRKMLGF